MAAPVPYSQLKLYTYYIVPTPSDEARFLTATYATNADEYVKKQRRLLLDFVGKKMHIMGGSASAFQVQLARDDGKIQGGVYFDETSFPPGQLFQEVGWDWKPGELAAAMPPDPAAAMPPDPAAAMPPGPVKLTDVLSQADIDAQKQFARTIKPDEARALNEYKEDGYSFMGPLMIGMTERSLGVVDYARQETRADSTDPELPPLPKERPGPGFIREFMAGFLSVLSRAPKLTQEINVFRGVLGKGGLNIDGTMVMSTSYDEDVALSFSSGKGECCMLKINVKPGVRIFAWDPDPESEIMILPPYKAQIENVGRGIKKVTITPVKYRGGTRRRGNRRRTRLRQTKKLTSKL
jgi:hypothetical protein